MHFWKGVLAGSLGVLALAAFVQAQTGNDRRGLEARSVPAAAQRPAHPTQPDTLSSTGLSYYNIDAYELVAVASGITFVSNRDVWAYNDDHGFHAPLHLPSGAMIVSIELDYYDNSATGEVTTILEVCDYTGTSCTAAPASSGCSDGSSTVCSGVPDTDGNYYRIADLTGAGIEVNNYYNRYLISAGNSTFDGTTAISRISIGYKLQVSPGPASATFKDVPTSHPFFKFVEALHAAGITNGYPDGRFGVNDPITRGQMAVYLSSALGLNWP